MVVISKRAQGIPCRSVGEVSTAIVLTLKVDVEGSRMRTRRVLTTAQGKNSVGKGRMALRY